MGARVQVTSSVALVVLAGCASVLGGLEEGAPRSDVSAGPSARLDPPPPPGHCQGWLAGLRYRVPLRVSHRGAAVPGYQVPLHLDTSALIAAGKLRADAADLRVTTSDGVTLAPHWLQGGPTTSDTTLWLRLDLDSESRSAWLYYGLPTAAPASSLSMTFMTGVIDDPSFARADTWLRYYAGPTEPPVSRTNEWSATFADGRATLRIVRQANVNGAVAGICQTLLFPSGSSYRVASDVGVAFADRGAVAVTAGGVGGEPLWETGVAGPGPLAAETRPIEPGTKTLCLGVRLEGSNVGQGIEATYARPRVRRWLPDDPHAERAGDEEERCP